MLLRDGVVYQVALVVLCLFRAGLSQTGLSELYKTQEKGLDYVGRINLNQIKIKHEPKKQGCNLGVETFSGVPGQ